MTRPTTTDELARIARGTLRGAAGVPISGVATFHEASPTDVTWISDPFYARQLGRCRAGAVIARPDLPESSIPAILTPDVEAGIAAVLAHFDRPPWHPARGIHGTAVVDSSAEVSPDACVGPHVVIGPRSTVAANSILHAGVVLSADVSVGQSCEFWPHVFVGDRSTIGNRVIIWPNAVIGRPGFGFIFRDGRHQRIPQIGTVVIEDDVEIGAGTAVDRAKCGTTRIGAGTKIDNHVQVAHNVVTGPGCILISQVGLAGSVRLGTGVILGGQVGVTDNVSLGDGVRATAQTGVTRSVPAHTTVEGRWGRERMRVLREEALTRRLPELLEKFKELARRIQTLEAAADDRKTR